MAFLLPAMIHTEYQSIPRSERNGPNVLVLAPTRELALQIEKEVAKYSFRGMKAYVSQFYFCCCSIEIQIILSRIAYVSMAVVIERHKSAISKLALKLSVRIDDINNEFNL